MTMTEGQAVMALKFWVGERHWCFPNVMFGGCEMDLAVVTRPAALLWEMEIKLTAADWKADQTKAKWDRPERQRVARMFYAVPTKLLEKQPSFVPVSTGILELYWSGTRPMAREHRTARPVPAPKITEGQLRTLLESTHYRFWREREHRHRAYQKYLAQRLRERAA